MLARIEVDGGDPLVELAALEAWLRSAPELRGLVRRERAAPRPGEMGALGDVLVAALGGGGAITALAAALGTWLMTRRGQVSIKVTGGGRQVEIDIKSADPEALLRTILAGGQPLLAGGLAAAPAAEGGTDPGNAVDSPGSAVDSPGSAPDGGGPGTESCSASDTDLGNALDGTAPGTGSRPVPGAAGAPANPGAAGAGAAAAVRSDRDAG